MLAKKTPRFPRFELACLECDQPLPRTTTGGLGRAMEKHARSHTTSAEVRFRTGGAGGVLLTIRKITRG